MFTVSADLYFKFQHFILLPPPMVGMKCQQTI